MVATLFLFILCRGRLFNDLKPHQPPPGESRRIFISPENHCLGVVYYYLHIVRKTVP